jgi:integrase
MKIATINRNIAMLKAALSRAVEWNLLDEHPLRRVKLLREDSRAKVRYLSDDEDQRLYDALDAREERLREKRASANAWRDERGYDLLPDLRKWPYADHLKPMIVLSLNLGVRRGELFNLTWADVDLRTRNIHIAGEGTKSGLTRHIPLNETAHACLRDWKKQTRGSGLVFVNQHGHRFDHCNTAWRGVLVEAGIKNYRWHDQRHTFASRLVVEGVDLNTVRELLGHSDLSMTLRYAHLAPHVKQDAVDTLTRNRGAATFPSPSRKKA